MKTKDKILQMLSSGHMSPDRITHELGISKRAVFKHLSDLEEKGEIEKFGTSPSVAYSINSSIKVNKESKVETKIKDYINDNYLYVSALGDIHYGLEGFIKWASRSSQPNIEKLAMEYFKLSNDIAKHKIKGLINGKKKLTTTFGKIHIDEVFYIDFYSIPKFGKTKLGSLLL